MTNAQTVPLQPRLGRRRTSLFALGLACLLSAAGVWAQGLPPGHEPPRSLEAARQGLWDLRESGKLTQLEYLRQARQLEHSLRSGVLQPIMDELGIRHTGNPPSVGGGIFSDVDGTAPTEAAYQAFLQRIKQLDPDVQVYDRYSFRSPKFDLVGWRPGASVPRARGIGADFERHLGQSLNNELAPTAIPGGGRPSALEANLEDLSKGAAQMFEPVKPGYAGEADMVAAGKDVMRSMRAAGLCERQALTCRWLTDLRSRTRSPRELGFANLSQLQQRLIELAGEAYRESQAQFAREHADLVAQLRRAATGPQRDLLVQLADQMAERAARMAARYEALHQQHPRIGEITGGKPPSAFWAEQNERTRQLRQAQQQASQNVAGARSLTVLLNLAEFARCMGEETSGRQDARRAQARRCLVEAVRNQLIARGLEQALGKSINFISVTLPNGAAVASVLPAALAGMAAVESGLQVIDAGFELWLLNDAWIEEQQRAQALEQAQIRNVAEFPRRLAAAEAVVAEVLRDIAARQKALSEALAQLATQQSRLIERARLRERRARLEALLPGIKARADACWQALGEAAGGPPDGAAALDEALGQARELVAACPDRAALQRADALFQTATQRLAMLRQEARRPPPAPPAPEPPQAVQALAEASREAAALEEVAAGARDNARELDRFPDRVQALNDSIERDREGLQARLEALQQSVPLSLVQALQQHTPRLRALRQRIDGIAPMPTGAWQPRWDAARGRDAPLRAVLEYMQADGTRVARVLAEADDCQQRRAGADALLAQLERAEETWSQSGGAFRAQRAACQTRLDQAQLLARLRQRVAQEQAAQAQRYEAARQTREHALGRHDAAQRQVQALLAAREGLASPAAGRPAAGALTTDLAGSSEWCGQAQQARAKLAETLRLIEADGQSLEDALTDSQQLAGRCADRRALDQARTRLAEASALQTRIDQRAAALPLLAVQVDDLVAQRRRLLKSRDEAAAALAQAPAPATVAAAASPIDFNPLDAALLAMRQQGSEWARQELERQRALQAALRAEFGKLDAATLDAALMPLSRKGQETAALAWSDAELRQRAELGVALRQRADAAARHAPRGGDWRSLQSAHEAAACLEQQALPNMAAGLQQADTLRSVAALATRKLGTPAREHIATCSARLDRRLGEPDKRAQVAAKVCRYPGSEPVWDEREYRPMCRCQSGRRWNEEQTACVTAAKPPAGPPPVARTSGWVGHWTCRFDAGARSLGLQRQMPERLVMVIKQDPSGQLLVSDGNPPWDRLPLTDSTHFQLPPVAPGATPLVFELRGEQIVGQMRMKVEGVPAYISALCRR